jgi:hypothetical protein
MWEDITNNQGMERDNGILRRTQGVGQLGSKHRSIGLVRLRCLDGICGTDGVQGEGAQKTMPLGWLAVHKEWVCGGIGTYRSVYEAMQIQIYTGNTARGGAATLLYIPRSVGIYILYTTTTQTPLYAIAVHVTATKVYIQSQQLVRHHSTDKKTARMYLTNTSSPLSPRSSAPDRPPGNPSSPRSRYRTRRPSSSPRRPS